MFVPIVVMHLLMMVAFGTPMAVMSVARPRPTLDVSWKGRLTILGAWGYGYLMFGWEDLLGTDTLGFIARFTAGWITFGVWGLVLTMSLLRGFDSEIPEGETLEDLPML